jgi:hypothetical protein
MLKEICVLQLRVSNLHIDKIRAEYASGKKEK